MSEREGSPEDFANLFGRDPELAPADDGLDRVVDRAVEEPRVETRAEAWEAGEEISHADLIARAGPSEAKLARDAEFFRMLHPTESE